jgi:hypothetical protein
MPSKIHRAADRYKCPLCRRKYHAGSYVVMLERSAKEAQANDPVFCCIRCDQDRQAPPTAVTWTLDACQPEAK